MTEVKNYDSSSWKYIAKNWSTLDNYTLWEIGNGKRINAWDECWMEKGLKLREVKLNNSSIQDNIMLSNLLDIQGDWNWSFIKSKVPTDIEHPLRDSNQQDICIWSGTTNGEFSIASSYENITQPI